MSRIIKTFQVTVRVDDEASPMLAIMNSFMHYADTWPRDKKFVVDEIFDLRVKWKEGEKVTPARIQRLKKRLTGTAFKGYTILKMEEK